MPIPEFKTLDNNEFRMMIDRIEGQFNTIVYEYEDIYRGQKHRWVVLIEQKR